MPVYVIAQISIDDRHRYERYASRFTSVLEDFEGRLLAADESAQVVEGEWPYDKIVLLEFPSREEFERWSQSPAYAEIARDRLAATRGCVLLVTGLDGPK